MDRALQLEHALRHLINAAAEVVDSWEGGDLAAAVRNLKAEAEDALEVLNDAPRS